MNKIMRIIMGHNHTIHELGYALIRIGIGTIFVIFGFEKLCSGSENIIKIGSAMTIFGIIRGYLLWGYAAAITELCGGLAYIFGFCTRLVSLPLLWLLFVAIRYHLNKGDAFTIWGFACTLFIVLTGFFIAGSGLYSLDYFLITKKSKSGYEL